MTAKCQPAAARFPQVCEPKWPAMPRRWGDGGREHQGRKVGGWGDKDEVYGEAESRQHCERVWWWRRERLFRPTLALRNMIGSLHLTQAVTGIR